MATTSWCGGTPMTYYSWYKLSHGLMVQMYGFALELDGFLYVKKLYRHELAICYIAFCQPHRS